MEYFDLYDENGQKINKVVERGTMLEQSEYHIVVNIWIRNSSGLYLIQQRNKEYDKRPFMWATTAGAVVAGDNSFITAIKETQEEMGISLNKDNLQFIKRHFVKDNFANFILDVYLIEEDILIKDLVLDKMEVKDAIYASMKEIKEQVINNTFIDYNQIVGQNDYFDLIEKS